MKATDDPKEGSTPKPQESEGVSAGESCRGSALEELCIDEADLDELWPPQEFGGVGAFTRYPKMSNRHKEGRQAQRDQITQSLDHQTLEYLLKCTSLSALNHLGIGKNKFSQSYFLANRANRDLLQSLRQSGGDARFHFGLGA